MSRSLFFASVLLLFLQSGCGVVAGTVIDTTIDIAAYPIKEYISWGAYKYDNTWKDEYKKIAVEKDPGDILLGVCISGGGSRSAYYMACVLEELSRIQLKAGGNKTLLDEVDYISTFLELLLEKACRSRPSIAKSGIASKNSRPRFPGVERS